MSTYTTIENQRDMALNGYKWTKPAELIALTNDQKEPFCVLDIRYGKEFRSFEFIVSVNNVLRLQGSEIEIQQFDNINEEHRNWLLAKFKRNLRSMGLIDRMKAWALDRLSLLKEFCELKGIVFDCLYTRSSLPPVQARMDQEIKMNLSIEGGRLNNGQQCDQIEGSRKKKKCTSVKKRTLADSSRLVISRNARLRAVHNHLKIMISKYKTSKLIDKHDFLEELESVNAYIYDF